ncbi:MAG: neutral zinc metallopeptidase [Comamonadaceae bacterium]|nr:neutral zinc metallopeptidase [Comamonadaceae bacterium]
MQRQAAGLRACPDAFTHGSSAQRVRWFKRGLESRRGEAVQYLRGEEAERPCGWAAPSPALAGVKETWAVSVSPKTWPGRAGRRKGESDRPMHLSREEESRIDARVAQRSKGAPGAQVVAAVIAQVRRLPRDPLEGFLPSASRSRPWSPPSLPQLQAGWRAPGGALIRSPRRARLGRRRGRPRRFCPSFRAAVPRSSARGSRGAPVRPGDVPRARAVARRPTSASCCW